MKKTFKAKISSFHRPMWLSFIIVLYLNALIWNWHWLASAVILPIPLLLFIRGQIIMRWQRYTFTDELLYIRRTPFSKTAKVPLEKILSIQPKSFNFTQQIFNGYPKKGMTVYTEYEGDYDIYSREAHFENMLYHQLDLNHYREFPDMFQKKPSFPS
jgi:hypothetical protein